MHEKVATSFYISFHSNGFVVITLVQITLFQLNFVLTSTVRDGVRSDWGGISFYMECYSWPSSPA